MIIKTKNKKDSNNNFIKECMVYHWMISDGLNLFKTAHEMNVYRYIVRMNIGYGQYETARLSYAEIGAKCKIKSRATIAKTLKSLKDSNLIKTAKSNKTNEQLKQAYKYLIVFRNDFNFPNIGLLNDSKDSTNEKDKPRKTFRLQ